jgi:hypothetical protein
MLSHEGAKLQPRNTHGELFMALVARSSSWPSWLKLRVVVADVFVSFVPGVVILVAVRR